MKSINLLLLGSLAFVQSACVNKGIQQRGPQQSSATMPNTCEDSICKIRIPGYPQEVAVLIPPYADFKNITIFFHGFSFGKPRDKNLTSIMQDFNVVQSFKESKSNRVLIIPFSSGQNVDYKKFIQSKAQLKAFLSNVYSIFAMKVPVETVQIIAHSGAYVTTQNLISDNSIENRDLQITTVTLLDATYSEFSPRTFVNWLQSGDHKMTVIYLKNSPTENKALQLWSLFSGQKPGAIGGFNLENGDYLTLIPETEVRNMKDGHWLLVRKWFGRVL